MKKVLFLSFIFLFLSCARESKDVNSSQQIKTVETISKSSMDSVPSPIDAGKVKVYIENTLSMYGYLPKKSVTGTGFRNAVNELLIESKNSYGKQNVDLFLINNEATVSVSLNSNLDNIDERTLRSKYQKGNGISDFDELFGKIIKEFEQDEIVVFIADFIYSPGRDTDVNTGLDRLRQNITDAFQNAKGSEPLAVNILHLESDFHGPYYYDNDNKSVSGINNRPYYIFIIGNEKNVKEFSKQVVPQLQRYDLKNEYHLTPSSTKINNYSALPFTLNIGQYEGHSSTGSSKIKTITVKNSSTNKGNIQLAVAIDLREVPVSEDYLMNIDNYHLSDGRIKLVDVGKIASNRIQLGKGKEEVIKSNDIARVNNTTHAFLLSFPKSYKGEIELSLNKNLPKWVEKVSIDDRQDDRDIQMNVQKQSQTFGFNYIVEGIYNAQAYAYPENEYFRITLHIDQQKSGSGIGAIIGWLIGLLIIFIIIVIIIRNKQRK